jgi:hypothetical protein
MKALTITVIIFCILVVVGAFGLAIWTDRTSPYSKYSCGGEGYTLKKFDRYVCIDCCYVEIDGFYEFKFPNWERNNSKLIIKTSELR